jgi:hypothetical protein
LAGRIAGVRAAIIVLRTVLVKATTATSTASIAIVFFFLVLVE